MKVVSIKKRPEEKISLPIPGVKVQDNQIVFPDSYSDEDIKTVCKKLDHTKQVFGTMKAYVGTDTDREKIQKMVQKGVEVTDFGIYQVIASSTRIDITKDKFEKPILDKMAEHYNEGRTVVFGSHEGSKGVGRTFEAQVVQAPDGEYDLLVKFYVPETAPFNAKELIDAGVYNRASISIFGIVRKYIPDSESVTGSSYWEVTDNRKLQTLHLAIVDHGANADAIMKDVKSQSEGLITFGEIENQKDMSDIKLTKITIKSLDNENVELTDEGVAVVKRLEEKIESLETVEKKWNAHEKSIRDKYVSLQMQLNKDATDAEKQKFQRRADALEIDLLIEDIADLEKSVKALKAKQTDPSKAAERKAAQDKKGEEGDEETKKKPGILI